VLEALPDNAVRMLIEQFDATGKITYGPSSIRVGNESYRVTIDYIYSDTINRKFFISKSVLLKDGGEGKKPRRVAVSIHAPLNDKHVKNSEQYQVSLHPANTVKKSDEGESEFMEYNIPIYVGLGLRTSSIIYAVKSNANISGLGIIGAEAEANNLRGSLTIQTLGVNGKSIAAALPIQSELNRTTVQNAIVAIGTIKALLHSPETWISPRVVGLYLPFPGGKALVNALISEVLKEPVMWEMHCPTRRRNG